VQARPELILLSFLLLTGCSADKQRIMLDKTATVVIDESAKANAICKALTGAEVGKITGSLLISVETAGGDAHWCRYTLQNGNWFSISSGPWYRAVDIPLDCYDEQNAPDAYKKIHHPFCMTILGDKRLQIVSSQYRGVSKSLMKELLKSATPRLTDVN
jgi:hypothetical protein